MTQGAWNTDPDYPDGLYLMIGYRSAEGRDWNLDLWFIRDGTTQFDLQHMETLPPRLTPAAREAILRIKESLEADGGYGTGIRGYDVYEAVLDHAVETPEAFASYLRHRAGPG
jgi:hypothetical protein